MKKLITTLLLVILQSNCMAVRTSNQSANRVDLFRETLSKLPISKAREKLYWRMKPICTEMTLLSKTTNPRNMFFPAYIKRVAQARSESSFSNYAFRIARNELTIGSVRGEKLQNLTLGDGKPLFGAFIDRDTFLILVLRYARKGTVMATFSCGRTIEQMVCLKFLRKAQKKKSQDLLEELQESQTFEALYEDGNDIITQRIRKAIKGKTILK